MKDKKLYFGHPVNTYNTKKELELAEIIQKEFPDHLLENPNHPRHQEAYREWKERTGNGMDYFFTQVLPLMSAGIFLPFTDRMFGAGVFGEAAFIAARKKPVYEISYAGKIVKLKIEPARALSIEQTRERLAQPKEFF